MDWIRVDGGLVRHPKTVRLARRLGITRAAAVGHLVALWAWAAEYYQHGNLSACEPEELADGAIWDGDPGALVEAMRACGFLDPDGGLHDWEQYQGALVAKRERDRERIREQRAQRQPRDTAAAVAPPSRDSRATVARHPATVARNETRRDETNETNETLHHAPPAGGRERVKPTGKAALEGFDSWYAVYTRHEGRAAAERAWAKLTAAERQECATRTPAWIAAKAGTEVRFLPLPATYLNGKRWRDELSRARPDPLGLRAGAQSGSGNWEWGFSAEDQAAYGDTPDWERYLTECSDRHGWGAELGAWPSFADWQREVA